jgi:hypothetical protein
MPLSDTERPLGLHSAYVEYLEWDDAFKTKGIKVLEKKVHELSDLNTKEYDGAQQEVSECEDKYNKCLDQYLDFCYICVTARPWTSTSQ